MRTRGSLLITALVAAASMASTAQGSAREDSLTVLEAGTVDFQCLLTVTRNEAIHGAVSPDRDGDGNISEEEAMAHAEFITAYLCADLLATMTWGGPPTSNLSASNQSGLVGPVAAVAGVTIRFNGTAHFLAPSGRLSSLSFDAFRPSAWQEQPAPLHCITLALPPEWEVRSVDGVDWTYAAPNGGGGEVTRHTVTFVLSSPHQFPRDDWPLVIGVSSVSLVAAALATFRWLRRSNAAPGILDGPIASNAPADDDTL